MKPQLDWSFEIQFYESILAKEPKYEEVIELLGHLYTQVGRIDDGLKMDKKMVSLKPHNPMVHYNLACSYALKHLKDEALKSLAEAIALGYKDLNWMLKDEDLKNLHGEAEFEKLIAQMRSKV